MSPHQPGSRHPAGPPLDTPAGGQLEWLCLALVITFAAHALPEQVWALTATEVIRPQAGPWDPLAAVNYAYLCALAFGLLLTGSSLRRSGLRLGTTRGCLAPTLLVCGGFVLLAAVVYPRLPVRPFRGLPAGMWLISPLAQELVFTGYLYGRLEPLFQSYVHPRVRVRWALVVTGLCFAAWHLHNLGKLPTPFVAFQLAYTFVGFVVVGLSRQWTGSILYATLTHSAVNWIAWSTS